MYCGRQLGESCLHFAIIMPHLIPFAVPAYPLNPTSPHLYSILSPIEMLSLSITLTFLQRLCNFVLEYPSFSQATVKIKYELSPKKNGKVDIDTLRDIRDWNLRETDELLEIMHQDGEGVSLMPYYFIEYLDEILYFESSEMLKNAKFVKRCKLCSRYFVLTDKRKRDFCDRPYKDNRTCKQMDAKMFYDKGMK